MSYDLFLQRRMKRTHSTEHARYDKDCSTSYTDLTLNEARIKRRPAVVHTMLQYSSLCAINMYSSCMIPVRNLQNQNVHYSSDALVFTYSKSTYMHIIRTCSIGRSYVGYYYTDLFVQSSLQFYMIPVFRTRTLQQQSNSSSSSRLRPRGTQGGGRYMLRRKCGFGRATWRVFVLQLFCYLSYLHNLPSYHTNEERRTNTMSGATRFQKQPYSRNSTQSTNRSSTQPQPAALRQPISFVSQGDYVCVVLCVYRVHRSAHV